MKHTGYNNLVRSNGSRTAQKMGSMIGTYALRDYGVGFSWPSISTGFSSQALYYSGSLNNIQPKIFAGKRVAMSVGADILASVGLNGSVAKVDNSSYVYGIGAGVGGGFWGGYFNLNMGNTTIKQ